MGRRHDEELKRIEGKRQINKNSEEKKGTSWKSSFFLILILSLVLVHEENDAETSGKRNRGMSK